MKKSILIELRRRVTEGCQCDYCGARQAEGVVLQYEAAVCEECYEDHHGRGA
jgi:hypothetical protein